MKILVQEGDYSLRSYTRSSIYTGDAYYRIYLKEIQKANRQWKTDEEAQEWFKQYLIKKNKVK